MFYSTKTSSWEKLGIPPANIFLWLGFMYVLRIVLNICLTLISRGFAVSLPNVFNFYLVSDISKRSRMNYHKTEIRYENIRCDCILNLALNCMLCCFLVVFVFVFVVFVLVVFFANGEAHYDCVP